MPHETMKAMVQEHCSSMIRNRTSALQYKDKLKDSRWLEFRKRVYRKDGYKCTICNTKDRPLNAHHRFYNKGSQPWDYSIHDLDTLCDWCHESIHGNFGDWLEQ